MYEEKLEELLVDGQNAIMAVHTHDLAGPDGISELPCQIEKDDACERIGSMSREIINLKKMMNKKIPALEALQSGSEKTLKQDSLPTVSVNESNSHQNIKSPQNKDVDGEMRHLKNTTFLLREAISSYEALLDEVVHETRQGVNEASVLTVVYACHMSKEGAYKQIFALH